MDRLIENFIKLCEKYKFKSEINSKYAFLVALDTDDKEVKWITYDLKSGKTSCLGNTDQCNLWLYRTRKDFTPEMCIEFLSDLNAAFGLTDEKAFLMSELIDPEDWQEIANVSDAHKDTRYRGSLGGTRLC